MKASVGAAGVDADLGRSTAASDGSSRERRSPRDTSDAEERALVGREYSPWWDAKLAVSVAGSPAVSVERLLERADLVDVFAESKLDLERPDTRPCLWRCLNLSAMENTGFCLRGC